MNLKNHYYYFTKPFSSEFCDKIVNKAFSLRKEKGTTGEFNQSKKTKKDLKEMLKLRDSDVIFLSEDWIYNEVVPFIKEANQKADWNFEFDWCESAQFTIYGKKQHYDWHSDSYYEPYNDPSNINHFGKIRKLSCTILLNDPREYKGGDFQFDLRNVKKGSNIITAKELSEKGSLIVFPSHIWHRVRPVTYGTRYSLVIWFIGKPFK